MMDQDEHLEMHYLVNNSKDEQQILQALNDSGYKYTAYNLAKDARRLIWHFTQYRPKPNQKPLINAFLDEKNMVVKEPKWIDDNPDRYWYFGYNTLNYDIPMIDHLLSLIIGERAHTTPSALREYSDKIIQSERDGTSMPNNAQSYARYANQVDCAMLNEKMVDRGRPTVGLKTLVGIKGGSIIESESNTSGHSDNIYQDTLYNINDVTELRDVVFPGQMEETFNIRRNLLHMYPELAKHGITVNSTSANFVEYIVSPDKPIDDMKTVNYLYPAKHIAKKYHAKQTDILEDTKNWYIDNVYKTVAKHNAEAAKRNLAIFLSIYHMYADVRGKNWNASTRHYEKYKIKAQTKEDRHKLFDKYSTFLPLIDKYGNDTGTYVNFSLGGLHGAEVFTKQLKQDRDLINTLISKYKYISKIPKKTVSAQLKNLIINQSRKPKDNDKTTKSWPTNAYHEVPELYKKTVPDDKILNAKDFTPFMYQAKGKSYPSETLLKRYTYTSIGDSVHQDFTSYYPTLMINLGVFYDGQDRDRYHEVYNHRVEIKKKLKTMSFGTPEYVKTDIEQLGYKLILNSASGILDASFDTKLRANNKAMAMRIIGQLFTYRIAQALALEGARVPSSNTDGIYVFDMPLDKNTKIVDKILDGLYIGIEPEPLYLVSKDANNRMEMVDGKITSARGATLTSWSGARVDNRLSHPAIVDRVMTYYLQKTKLTGEQDVEKQTIINALKKYQDSNEVLDEFKHFSDSAKRTFIYMTSWVMRSTSGSIFIDNHDNIYPGTVRAWLTKTGSKFTRYTTRKAKPSKSYNEYAEILPKTSKISKPDLLEYLGNLSMKKNFSVIDKYFNNADTVATYLKNTQTNTSTHIIATAKISGLPKNALLTINNHSLLKMSNDEIDQIFKQLDLNSYATMIAEFAKTWQNPIKKS